MPQIELQFIGNDDQVYERIELAEIPDEVHFELLNSHDEKKTYFNYLDRMTFEEEWDAAQVNKHKDKIAIAFLHLSEAYKPVWKPI